MLTGEKGGEHVFTAYDIDAFTDRSLFMSNMGEMLRSLRETPPSPGADRVVYAGLVDHETEVDRRANGVPLNKDVISWFDDICHELSVPPLKRT